MHRQVASLLSNGETSGKLAQYARMLANKKANIRAIGGAEWAGRGAVAVLVDDRTDDEELLNSLTEAGLPSQPIFAVEAVLDDSVGALADACEAIGDVNIASILVVDTHLGKGLVTFGFASKDDAATATERLGSRAVEPHSLTAAWHAHEQWDRDNPNDPPPAPPPANP